MAETPFSPDPGTESGGGVPLGAGQPGEPLSSPEPAAEMPPEGIAAPEPVAYPAPEPWAPAVPVEVPAEPVAVAPYEPAPWAPQPEQAVAPAMAAEVSAESQPDLPLPEPFSPEPPAPVPPAPVPSAPEPPAPFVASSQDAEPTPAAVAEPPLEPQPSPEPPGVAATITVPPLEEGAGGGEWQMLVNSVNSWLGSGELTRQWQRIRGPLKGVAIVLVLLVVLRLYATVVATIDAIPLVSGLLELAGLIAVLQFSLTRLVRSSDRQQLLDQVQRRWQDFRGNN